MTHPQQMAEDVTAVFVTMNRCDTAAICLNKLLGQTQRPGKVIVVNNASNDPTWAMLREFSEQNPGWIELIDSELNLGNAGGMEIAVEAAFSAGCKAVWILDDDSWPEPDTLACLLHADLPENAVRSCKVVDLATGALSWPVQVSSASGWNLLVAMEPLPTGQVLRIRRSWLGALIPQQVYQTVGPVDGRFFLRGEDEDYPRRIEKAGFPVFMITDSLLHHPPAGHLKKWSFAGRTLVFESDLAGDKLYYRLRNSWWIIRRDHGFFEAAMTAILSGFAFLLWERSNHHWARVWWEAARDALRNQLGQRKK